MRYLWLLLLTLLWFIPSPAEADCLVESPPATYTAGTSLRRDLCDTKGSRRVSSAYSFLVVTADTLVKTGAGILHTITCQSDAAATAGSIIVFDNTAESGTQIWNWVISAVEYQPRTMLFDAAFSTGLFVGYTTTADVNCTVTFQ